MALGRVIRVKAPKKTKFHEIGLCFFVNYSQTLVVTDLKIVTYYVDLVWLDFYTLGRFLR